MQTPPISDAARKWDLSGQVAVVTGGARGIGRNTAELLRRRGAKLVVSDIEPEVETLAADDVATLVGDVADEDVARRTITLAVERFGALDIMVSNAGRTLNSPLVDTSADAWDGVLRTNARGAFLHCREALRVMAPQGHGAIVAVVSMVAAVGLEGLAAYAASKGAIAQLIKVAAVEHGAHGVRVNAVAPGVVETDFLHTAGVADSRAVLASYGHAHLLGRVAQPGEIAEVIAFLVSPAASFMTGALVMADGGYTAI